MVSRNRDARQSCAVSDRPAAATAKGTTGCRQAPRRAAQPAEPKPDPIQEAVDRLVAARVEQGLPPTVKDPLVLAKIAAILRTVRDPGRAA